MAEVHPNTSPALAKQIILPRSVAGEWVRFRHEAVDVLAHQGRVCEFSPQANNPRLLFFFFLCFPPHGRSFWLRCTRTHRPPLQSRSSSPAPWRASGSGHKRNRLHYPHRWAPDVIVLFHITLFHMTLPEKKQKATQVCAAFCLSTDQCI